MKTLISLFFGLLVLALTAKGAAAQIQRYSGEDFDPAQCEISPGDTVSLRVGDAVFDVPRLRLDYAIPSETSGSFTVGDAGSMQADALASDLMCPERPLQSLFVVLHFDHEGEKLRYSLRENNELERTKKRADMLRRMRKEADCPPFNDFILCNVTENGGKEDVFYFLPLNKDVELSGGQSLHIRCTKKDRRCAIYDEIGRRTRVEFGRIGIFKDPKIGEYQALIEALSNDARSMLRP